MNGDKNKCTENKSTCTLMHDDDDSHVETVKSQENSVFLELEHTRKERESTREGQENEAMSWRGI